MQRGGWTAIVLTVGAAIAIGLLLGRGAAAAGWVLIPLGLWLGTAIRATTSLLAAAAQAAAVTIVALGARSPLSLWDGAELSLWDGVLLYSLLALFSIVAAERDPGLRWPGYPARQVLTRVARFAAPVALVVGCCLGTALALPVRPVEPVGELTLPDGVTISGDSTWCGPGPAVSCTRTFDVESATAGGGLLRKLVADALTGHSGWPADGACRTRGWVVQEHACLNVRLRDVGPGPPFAATLRQRVVVVLTYW